MIENKYKKLYYQIIENRKNNPLPNTKYTEKHHIIPKSLGGSNDPDNLVKLSAREHYLCHYLLTKFTIGNNKRKMIYGFNAFIMKGNGDQHERRINSVLYEKMRKELRKVLQERKGEKSPGYGRKDPPETNRKRSESLKQFYETDPGKQNRAKKAEQMSETMKGRIPSSVGEYIIYDNENVERYRIQNKGIRPFLKENNLPLGLKSSAQNNGRPMFMSSRYKKYNGPYKGWYCIKIG